MDANRRGGDGEGGASAGFKSTNITAVVSLLEFLICRNIFGRITVGLGELEFPKPNVHDVKEL